uniref:Uncharacterized protein n=1 Tax=Timema bartmani TaxID=61472 RepID=A0A7R9I3B6_9NEOP|nr:unnamed protein product [Timema bartmani]
MNAEATGMLEMMEGKQEIILKALPYQQTPDPALRNPMVLNIKSATHTVMIESVSGLTVSIGVLSALTVNPLKLVFVLIQYKSLIAPYLLEIVQGLPSAVWLDDEPHLYSDCECIGVPVAESFSFYLNTLLSDIAAKCMPFQENIVLVQVDLLSKLMSECIASKDQKYHSDAEKSRREPSLHRELGVGYVLPTTKNANLELPILNLQNIFTLVKQLLAKDTLEFLDQQVDALFDSGEIQDLGVFPYKTFSETLTLTMATMLKELLLHNKRK